jgi:hypothetical protein
MMTDELAILGVLAGVGLATVIMLVILGTHVPL